MVRIGAMALAFGVFGIATYARAQDKYQITDAERAACQGDAIQLCGKTYPDQDALLACMRANEAHLTPGCRPMFIAGLRRRGLR